jgi:hypothetical protein
MEFLDSQYIKDALEEYDVIMPKPFRIEVCSVAEAYCKFHNVDDMRNVENIINEKYPEYNDAFLETMNRDKAYIGNMIITSKIIFDRYCSWLFDILFELEKRHNISDYNNYQKRVYGFIAERLLGVWIKKHKLKIKETNIAYIQDDMKTIETSASLKIEIANMLRQGRIAKAINVYRGAYWYCRAIDYELRNLRKIFEIYKTELKDKQPTLFNYSLEFSKLIEHFYNICELLKQIQIDEYKVKDSFVEYMVANKVSYTCIIYIAESMFDNEEVFLNEIGMIFFEAGIKEMVMPFLYAAYELNNKNNITLYNLGYVLYKFGEGEMAKKYVC